MGVATILALVTWTPLLSATPQNSKASDPLLRSHLANVSDVVLITEHLGVNFSKLEKLAALPIKGYRPLDPTRPKKGKCDQRSSIQENLLRKT